eukprot:5443276-Amphidinium_carterae.2
MAELWQRHRPDRDTRHMAGGKTLRPDWLGSDSISLVRGQGGRPFEIIYESEQGRYPFSSVPRLPDVIPGDDESVLERHRLERKALFETIREENPDEYPWPGAPEELDPYCPNRDPKNGPVNWDIWFSHCHRQTLNIVASLCLQQMRKRRTCTGA